MCACIRSAALILSHCVSIAPPLHAHEDSRWLLAVLDSACESGGSAVWPLRVGARPGSLKGQPDLRSEILGLHLVGAVQVDLEAGLLAQLLATAGQPSLEDLVVGLLEALVASRVQEHGVLPPVSFFCPTAI